MELDHVDQRQHDGPGADAGQQGEIEDQQGSGPAPDPHQPDHGDGCREDQQPGQRDAIDGAQQAVRQVVGVEMRELGGRGPLGRGHPRDQRVGRGPVRR